MFAVVLSTLVASSATHHKDVLAGAIAIYFSAHWCPPCRFTPHLADWWKQSLKDKGMKIVFVSSDRDEASFESYYGEQPWVALPFADRDAKARLSKQFKVSGIPSLVIVDAEGATISTDGRSVVSKDPTGENYPWTPPTAAEKAQAMLAALGPEILAKAAGKPIGLYFSAHWCPPCRGFTPQLAKFYDEGLKDKMEIVFCSSDKDQAQFDGYAAEMPWLALPYEKRAEKEALSDACGVEGIPTFAVINPDGTIVTADGRSKVCADPTGASFPDGWLPQPFNSANDSTDGLNEEQCVLAMGDDEGLKQAVEAVAQEHFAAAGKDVEAMPMRFFHAPAGGISDQIRKLTGVDGNRLVLLDIPDNGSFYLSDADVGAADAAQVKDFVAKVKAGGVEKQSFKK